MVTLINSAVSGNSTGAGGEGGGRGGDGGAGGGIFAPSGMVTLTNSTVSDNSSGAGGIGGFGGDGAGGDGGGIYVQSANVSLVSSTVTGNSASGVGGGISADPSSSSSVESLTLHNSIVAGNTDDGTAPDIRFFGDVANDLVVENSLIGDTTGSEIAAGTGTGNILNQAALLGSLADNGGPTLTHRLLPGSPAIDAGNNFLGGELSTDQRGEARIAFGTVDIGAYELQSTTIGPRVISTVRDEGGVLARPDLLSTFVVTFDQDVDIDAGDLSIRNDTLGSLVDTSDVDFTYVVSNNTFTATWDFSSLVLDAAFYTFELSDSIRGVVGGLALDGNSDGTIGGNYVEEVYVAIPGDANLDGRVDVLGDAFALINNLGTTTDLAFSDGNFNGDGQVDVLGDAFILINNLGIDVRLPMMAQLRSNISQLSVVMPIQQASVVLPVSVSADVDQQERSKNLGSTSPAAKQPQLVLAGDHDLRDDVFGSEF